MSKIATERWGSRIGLILAMAGNAVGLGNFLRFPVQAITHGGGAFIIPYLVCFVLMGIPLLWMEWAMGRFGGQKGHHIPPFILQSMNERFPIWKYVGALGIFTNFAVAAYYVYIESWTLSYTFYSLFGTFEGKTPDSVAAFFNQYIGFDIPLPILSTIPASVFFWLICLGLNIWILSKDLKHGVEAIAKIGMPLLLLFACLLAFKGISLTAGGQDGAVFDGSYGLNFLWKPDFTSIWKPSVWLAAAGQIFFTLSVGMGSIQCYASFVKENDDIALNAMAAGWMNEFVEVVLGGAIIIPISIGYLGIDGVKELIAQGGGLGLGFKTLPYLFEQWGWLSGFAGMMWFALLFFAGITSSLAMGTPIVHFWEEEWGWSKKRAALLFGLCTFILGLPTVAFFQYGVFDEFDYWAGTISLVVFAIAETFLFAWIFGIKEGWAEVNRGGDIKAPMLFGYIAKYITPILLILVFVGSTITPRALDGKIEISYEVHKKDTLFWKDTLKGKEVVQFQAFANDTLVHRDTLKGSNEWAVAIDSLVQGKKWHFDDHSLIAIISNQSIMNELDRWKDSLSVFQSNLPKLKDSKKRITLSQKIENGHKRVVFLRKKRQFVNASRMLLLTLYAGICLMVYAAAKKRKGINP